MSNGDRTDYKEVFNEAENIKASFVVDLDICCFLLKLILCLYLFPFSNVLK